jgi:hypothetical protein
MNVSEHTNNRDTHTPAFIAALPTIANGINLGAHRGVLLSHKKKEMMPFNRQIDGSGD